MTRTDPRLQAALDAAMNQIRTTLTEVAGRVLGNLGTMAESSGRIAERDLMIAAQFDLRRNMAVLHKVFADELSQRVAQESLTRADPKRTAAAADWQSLSLVEPSEVEDRMSSDRIGQQISHACETELRDLAAYMGSLLEVGHASEDRNPLRAEVLGTALYRATEAVAIAPEARKVLARELGAAVAKAMPECYAQIVRGLQNRGVQPVVLTVRQVEGPGNQLPGVSSGYATLSSTRSQPGELDALSSSRRGLDSGSHGRRSLRSEPGLRQDASTPSTGSKTRSRLGESTRPAVEADQANARLVALLRHLTVLASRPGELDTPERGPVGSGGLPGRHSGIGRLAGSAAPAYGSSGRDELAYARDGHDGLMAVNLIRAHREELLQASGGKLDHMVIDVVGGLFDQILSDSRVPPQMARQIARLQLPVLRVALSDPSFFSSRRHPVRRFVNRIASLACAFDDFDEGPGKLFLDRVSALVQEIVEGDFDQIELYASKLSALEEFIAEQTHQQVQEQGTVGMLGAKEAELRLQQRYMLQLQAALAPLALPGYLIDFLPQVWSQALVLAVSRDGPGSDRAKRYRRVGCDLVMSVQPKGSPALRKKFLMQLPPLMKDLNEGLALVGWPQPAQREFFSKLLPAHAESLKGQALSELDYNMMVKQLEGIFNMPVPGVDSLGASDPVPEIDAEVIERRFTPEETKRIGFVTENSVDWSGKIDIDLGADAPTRPSPEVAAPPAASTPTQASALTPASASAPAPAPASTSAPAAVPAAAPASTSAPAAAPAAANRPAATPPGIVVDLELDSAEPAEPSRGAQLIDHLQLGFAYQMHLKDQWQKVRLAHMSAGRSFFVFTHGSKHQETISMTARMLSRMCETGRMRAVETDQLIERASQRARQQLAALGVTDRG